MTLVSNSETVFYTSDQKWEELSRTVPVPGFVCLNAVLDINVGQRLKLVARATKCSV